MAKALMTILGAASVSLALGYKAAFMEYEWYSPCGQGSCGQQTKAASVKAYATYAAQAAGQGAQIIVFPEYGITGESSYPKSGWIQGGYTEVIPEPTGQVPCDSQDSNAPSIVSLSCTAQQNKIAIVANLIDYQNGDIYNTDVAFDTNGALLAKYWKQNLWGETNIDVPKKCHDVTFKTSFGVTFGLFTCADLIYKSPGVDMVAKGIKNFAVPVAWTNEESDMQVMPYAQGWSAAYGVNLITANMRAQSSSGSGIWASGKPLASQYEPGSSSQNVVVAEVPESNEESTSWPESWDQQLNTTSGSNSQWQFVALSSGKVCSGSVCCTATVNAGGTSGYALAALDGNDGESGVTSYPAQVCAIFPCSSAGTGCLTHKSSSGSLQGVKLEMSGVTAEGVVPEVYATDGHGSSEILLDFGSGSDAYSFSHTGSQASITASTTKTLAQAIIYGRSFSKDRLPYSCPPSPSLV